MASQNHKRFVMVSPTNNLSKQILSKYGRTPTMIFEILRGYLDLNIKYKNKKTIFDERVWTYVTMAFLASKTQRSVPNVKNHIRRLRNDGIILVEHYGRVKGRNTNYYTLDLPKYRDINPEKWNSGKKSPAPFEKLFDYSWAAELYEDGTLRDLHINNPDEE